MSNYKKLLTSLLQDESGQDLIEYALVAGLIGVAAIVAVTSVGGSLTTIFNNLTTSLTNA